MELEGRWRPARPLRSCPRRGTGRKMGTSSSCSITSTSWCWKEDGDQLVLFDHVHVRELEGRRRRARPLRLHPRHGAGRKMETSSSSSIMSTSGNWKEEGDQLVLFDHVHVRELEGRRRPARPVRSRPRLEAGRKRDTRTQKVLIPDRQTTLALSHDL